MSVACPIKSGLQLGSAEIVIGLRNFIHVDRQKYQCTEHMKAREAKKKVAYIPHSKVICVQTGQHWYCSDDPLREIPERWDGARRGHSEIYSAVLRWKQKTCRVLLLLLLISCTPEEWRSVCHTVVSTICQIVLITPQTCPWMHYCS